MVSCLHKLGTLLDLSACSCTLKLGTLLDLCAPLLNQNHGTLLYLCTGRFNPRPLQRIRVQVTTGPNHTPHGRPRIWVWANLGILASPKTVLIFRCREAILYSPILPVHVMCWRMRPRFPSALVVGHVNKKRRGIRHQRRVTSFSGSGAILQHQCFRVRGNLRRRPSRGARLQPSWKEMGRKQGSWTRLKIGIANDWQGKDNLLRLNG